MNISKKLATGGMIILCTALYSPAFAGRSDQQQPREKTGVNSIEKPCEPLTWKAANRLPSWIKGSDVACMNPTVEDLQVSEQARALLIKVVGRAQDQGRFSTTEAEAEYNEGIVAYAEGRYGEAIAHFQAMPSVSRVAFTH